MNATTCPYETALAMVRHTEGLIKEYTAKLRELRRELEKMPKLKEPETHDTIIRCGIRDEIRVTERFLGVLRKQLLTQRETLEAAEAGRERAV